MIMVKAGGPVDAVIESLIPLLDKGDIIIDGGNSLYTDTERRDKWLGDLGFRFIGAGVSGGEEGARKGPSIMPGGPASTWDVMKPIFETIAAKVEGEPCVIHIGPGGAGHYVKMIHNGIEYGDMQLICEAYNIFKAAGFTPDGTRRSLHRVERTATSKATSSRSPPKIFEQKDPETGKPLVDLILDTAGQKGTGKWTLMNAVENAVVISTINAAVEARILSSMKDKRVAASKILEGPKPEIDVKKKKLVKKVHDALFASKIISYAQGLDLIAAMGAEKGWGLDLGKIAAIWRGGCIIRARFLNDITEAYRTDPKLEQPDARPVLHGPAQRLPGKLARSHLHRHPRRHPGSGVQRVARLLRQLPQRRASREPAASPARLLRRPHLRAHRQAARRDVPHRLARRHRLSDAGIPACCLLYNKRPGALPAVFVFTPTFQPRCYAVPGDIGHGRSPGISPKQSAGRTPISTRKNLVDQQFLARIAEKIALDITSRVPINPVIPKRMLSSVYPDEDSQVVAGGHVAFAAVALVSKEPYEPVADGTRIDWRLDLSGDGAHGAQSTTRRGIALFQVVAPTTAGVHFKATACFRGQSRESALVTVIPDRGTTFDLRYYPLSAEGEFIRLQVYCTDRFGNAANPARAIWWRLQGPFRLHEVETTDERSHYPVGGVFTVYVPRGELRRETTYPLELLFEIDDLCKVIDLRTASVRDHVDTYCDPLTGELKPCSQ